ncbi:MAG: hypothetical protein HY308_07875 [Gammaproteobacteria bacterium]|nr:hypothetical protein [Gammaproteobacteria bacterium]
MKAASGHPWITHGVAVLAVFVVLGFLLAKKNSDTSATNALNVVAIAIIAAAVISGVI